MENTIIKEMPIVVKKRIDAVIESEFDLDVRVFTLPNSEDKKGPQAFFTYFSCTYCSNSCVSCFDVSCFTCGC